MNANELADELDDIDAYEKHQTLLGKASETLRQQHAEIEALKLQLHTTLTNRDLRTYDGKAQEKTIQSVMAENCTCYKLGYSQLNNYRKVNNENNNEAA